MNNKSKKKETRHKSKKNKHFAFEFERYTEEARPCVFVRPPVLNVKPPAASLVVPLIPVYLLAHNISLNRSGWRDRRVRLNANSESSE